MFINHTKYIPFPEAKKIVGSYMGTKTYANVTQKISKINRKMYKFKS